jgi:hypothetical protein
MTRVLNPDIFGNLAVNRETVVDEKRLTGIYCGERVNELSIPHFDWFAVGCACMVDEAGAVATAAAIDHARAGQPEYERVAGSRLLAGGRTPSTGHLTLGFNKHR